MSEPAFAFKSAARLPKSLDPQLVGERLEALRRNGSGFTPAFVVDDARAEDSPLHAAFPWDDHAAAEAHRLNVAEHLIRSVVTIHRNESGESREVRAFLPVDILGTTDSGYLPFATVMKDPGYRAQVVARALGEMLALKAKYRDLQEFASVFAAMDSTAKAIRAA